MVYNSVKLIDEFPSRRAKVRLSFLLGGWQFFAFAVAVDVSLPFFSFFVKLFWQSCKKLNEKLSNVAKICDSFCNREQVMVSGKNFYVPASLMNIWKH